MRLVWARGGEATLAKMNGELVELVSTVPWPPGARVEATAGAQLVKLKVHGSKKQEDGTFVVNARLVDATRELRKLLAASLHDG